MSNLTIPANTTLNEINSILCPYNGRRSSKELWVKLFVVHLTTIAAFCHVLSVRREPIVRWKLVFYILLPFSIFAYHALALVAFLLALVSYLIKPSDDLKDSLWRAPSWFFGTVPREDEGGDYELLPSAARPAAPAQEPPERESKWKMVGRVLLASTFLVQCIGTVVLYNRRRQHHAATFADQRVFELGCSGILTALYWLALTLELPPFSKPTPTLHADARNALDAIMITLRDCPVGTLVSKNEEMPVMMSFIKNGALCFLIELAERKLRLFEFLANFIYEFRTGETLLTDDFTMEYLVFIFGFSISGLISVLACCGTPQSKQSRLLGKRRRKSKDDDRPWWLCCLCPFGIVCLWLPVLVFIGGIIVFIMCPFEWSNITTQISTLDAWPTNTTCPLLWSDPAANWIWALA